MKHELRIFFTALMYYTRLPCPAWVGHEEDYLNQATRYFPLIGWIAGAFSALVYLTGTWLFGLSISVLLSMIASILLTGAFHEDGLADFCDGFGGGWTRDKILNIMKDSRVGTYGLTGLVLLLGLKFLTLRQLLESGPDPSFTATLPHALYPFLLFITAHSLSRFTASIFIFTHTYSRESGDSKAKPVAQNLNPLNLSIAWLFAFIPLLILAWLVYQPAVFAVLVPLIFLHWYLGRYFNKWIGGYTGDCLGAAQQISEVLIYLSLILIWKFF